MQEKYLILLAKQKENRIDWYSKSSNVLLYAWNILQCKFEIIWYKLQKLIFRSKKEKAILKAFYKF